MVSAYSRLSTIEVKSCNYANWVRKLKSIRGILFISTLKNYKYGGREVCWVCCIRDCDFLPPELITNLSRLLFQPFYLSFCPKKRTDYITTRCLIWNCSNVGNASTIDSINFFRHELSPN
ncbi:hypothetical protein CFAEC_05905 [Corynebacterium faecale]|nr:hypothetical protein CFAEC_05905 [Corynebacterium faecale]